MSFARLRFASAALALAVLAGCTGAAADRSGADSAAVDTLAGTGTGTAGTPAAAAVDTPPAGDSGFTRVDVQPDSLRADTTTRDSVRHDTAGAATPPVTRAPEPISWPAPPTPLPGALLPANRIIAYYGNPLSKRMGILGEIPPDQMMARLERTAAEWQKADAATNVLPALHLIATVAQGGAGRDGKYRLRMTDSLIKRVAGWAEQKGWLLFLDIQPGHSTVEAEAPRLMHYLTRPNVHFALDPEFAMTGRGDGALPGKKIGTLDAREINFVIDTMAKIVTAYNLPPKVLVIHRFTERMITNYDKIRRDPRVQVVIDMDGFGPPSLKRSTWRYVVRREPVQYTGIKLFYKNDKPLLTPSQVLEQFKPEPVYVQYQ